MNRNILKTFNLFFLAVLFGLLAMSLSAQERATVQVEEKEAVLVQQAITAKPANPGRVKRGDVEGLRAAIQQCGTKCDMSPSGTIAAPGSGPLDYNCDDDGNCACFGASDCVAMTDVCKEGTMGCNNQGCICEEDTGGGG